MPEQPGDPPEGSSTEGDVTDVRRVFEVYAEALRTVLQEQIDEVAEGLRKQLQEALEEHRRSPHVGGQRVDDLERVLQSTFEQLRELVPGFEPPKDWEGRT